MTSNFWKGLFENLGTRLNFSSAYHPQTDGQSEIANLTVSDLLKAYVTEVDQRSQWEKYLPLVEYAYNNTVHTSTGKAPFEVIEGRPKSPLLLKVHGKIFAADEYSRDLKESFQKIKEAISIAQQKQKAAANKHRRALAFKENDWVLLKFPKARLRYTTGKNPTGHQKYYAKLAKRYYGPFQILKPINEMAYQLKLPKHWLIHNAFHVSLLKPYKGEPPKEAIMKDPLEAEGQEEVLQPESLLRHENKVLKNGKIIRRYLIKFKNYPFEDAKWMQGTQLKDSLHLVNAYNDSLEEANVKMCSLELASLHQCVRFQRIPAMVEQVPPLQRKAPFPEEVLEHVLTFITSHKDRNAVSLVCKSWYHVEALTRQHVFIGNCYSVSPASLAQRFKNLKSLTIKGKPRFADFGLVPAYWGAYADPWVSALVDAYPWFEELRLKRMTVSDDCLSTLARSFPNFRVLVLTTCDGFTTRGLAQVAANCRYFSVIGFLVFAGFLVLVCPMHMLLTVDLLAFSTDTLTIFLNLLNSQLNEGVIISKTVLFVQKLERTHLCPAE
ncbi:hypothetical protein L7F22_004170 [Adiantum nelumboides]|nr:hypothetical protein [Adiantum nelumboides]